MWLFGLTAIALTWPNGLTIWVAMWKWFIMKNGAYTYWTYPFVMACCWNAEHPGLVVPPPTCYSDPFFVSLTLFRSSTSLQIFCTFVISKINRGFRGAGLQGAGYDVGSRFARCRIRTAPVTQVCLTEKTGSGRPGPYNVQLTVVSNNCYERSVCVWQCTTVCVCARMDERGGRAVACASLVK